MSVIEKIKVRRRQEQKYQMLRNCLNNLDKRYPPEFFSFVVENSTLQEEKREIEDRLDRMCMDNTTSTRDFQLYINEYVEFHAKAFESMKSNLERFMR